MEVYDKIELLGQEVRCDWLGAMELWPWRERAQADVIGSGIQHQFGCCLSRALSPAIPRSTPVLSGAGCCQQFTQHTFTNLTSPLCRHFTSHPAVQSHNGSPPPNNQGPPPPHQQTPPSGSHHGHSPSGPYPHPKTPPHRPLRLPPIQSPHLLLLWRTY